MATIILILASALLGIMAERMVTESDRRRNSECHHRVLAMWAAQARAAAARDVESRWR